MLANPIFRGLLLVVKLAFCLFKYFPYGGLQRDFLRFLEEAVRRSHQVSVYCYSWEGARPPGINITLLPARGWSNHAQTSDFITCFQQAVKDKPVDVVFGFNKMPGLDFYYAADSCFEAKAQTERSWLYRMSSRYRHYAETEKAVFSHDSKTRIFLISATEKAKFVQYYNTPEERMFMLPPGISRDRCADDTAPARRKAMRRELRLRDDEKLILFIGSGFIKKGLDRVISAVASLPAELRENTRLLVVGQGKPERYQKQARHLGVAERVEFTGGRRDIPELLFAGDLLVHPALDEAAGIVLLEATVSGLPVIVTDVCGYAHHISSAGSGVVLPSPFSQSGLNTSLADALLHPEKRKQWQANALTYAENADLYSMHATGLDLIEKHHS